MTLTNVLTVQDWIAMLMGARVAIREHVDQLSSLDRAIGDGDHGTSMRRAMDLVVEELDLRPPATTGEAFAAAGRAILGVDGGATGPLWGSFFLGMSTNCMEETSLDGEGVAAALAGGVEKLGTRTKARVGDKTMMDALIPAADAARGAVDGGLEAIDVLDRAASAAEAGAASTEGLRATFGRAKHQGDRVIGHRDPGAESAAVILRSFANVSTQRHPATTP